MHPHSSSSSFRRHRRSLYRKSNFIPFLQRDPSINNHIRLTQQSREILLDSSSNNGGFGVISLVWGNRWATEYCRKMLLKTYDDSLEQNCEDFGQSPLRKISEFQLDSSNRKSQIQHNNKNKRINNENPLVESIKLHTKVQIGQSERKQPINWIYFEVEIDTECLDGQNLKLLQTVLLMSSLVFYEIPNRKSIISANSSNNDNTSALQFLKTVIQKDQQNEDLEESILIMSENNYSPSLHPYDLEKSTSINSTLLHKQSSKVARRSIFPEIVILHSDGIEQLAKEELTKLFSQKQIDYSFIDIGCSESCTTKQPRNPIIHSLTSIAPLKRSTSMSFQFNQKQKRSQSFTKTQMKPDIIDNILKQSKQYTYRILTKRNSLNGRPVSGNLLISFIQNYLNSQLATNQVPTMTVVHETWERVLESQEKRVLKKCVQIYEQKFTDLTLNKTLMSPELFEEAQRRAKYASLNFLQKNSVQHRTFTQKVQNHLRCIQKGKRELSLHKNAEWGKELLFSSYEVVTRKIKNQQICELNSFKKEIITFRTFFRKKCEQQFSSGNILSDCFEQFILERIFDAVSIITSFEKQSLSQQLDNQKLRIQVLQNEQEQFKTKNKTVQNDHLSKIALLEQNNERLRMREQLLQMTNQKLQKQTNQLSGQIYSKFQEKQQQLVLQMTYHKNRILQLQDQLNEASHKILASESQVKKQKLLHQKSRQHYQLLLSQKQKQQLSATTFSKLSLKSARSLHQISQVNSSHLYSKTNLSYYMPEEEQEENKKKLTSQIKELKKEIITKSEHFEQYRRKSDLLLLQIQFKLDRAVREKDQLQLQIQNMGQKLNQTHNVLSRYRRNQQQSSKVYQNFRAEASKRQSTERELTLQDQKIQLLQQRIIQQETLVQKLSEENRMIKQQIQQQLQRKEFRQEKQVQVQDLSYKVKMNEALRVVGILQKEHIKMKAYLQKHPFRF